MRENRAYPQMHNPFPGLPGMYFTCLQSCHFCNTKPKSSASTVKMSGPTL